MSGHIFAAADRWRGCDRGPVRRQPRPGRHRRRHRARRAGDGRGVPRQVLAAGEGTDNMKTIAQAVQEGANAYLTRQFRTLAIFAAIAFFAAARAAGRRHDGPDLPLGVLPRRRRLLRDRRLPRHEPRGARQPARRRGGRDHRGPRAGHDDRPAHRRHGRHAHRRPRPARRQPGGAVLPGRGARRARGLRLRRRAARDVHAGRRRHLHQGRRRRRRPGRQGRAEHPRGRPAQRRDHRRQRRRQRRRLRRHGRRPLRVVRRDAGRRADPRLAGLRRQGPGLPAADPGHRRAHRGRRRLPDQAQGRRERPDDDQPVVLPLLRHRRGGQRRAVLPLPAGQLRRVRTSPATFAGADGDPRLHRLGRGRHRHRDVRRHPGADRLLHRHRVPPGQGRRQDLADRRRDRDPVRPLGRLRVGGLHHPGHRRRRVRRLPPRRRGR